VRGLGRVEGYTPLQHPYYAYGPQCGSRTCRFDAEVQTDEVLAKTSVSFTSRVFSLDVVSFYRATRYNQQYTSPYIENADDRECPPWYYWRYRNDDRLSYEVLESPQ